MRYLHADVRGDVRVVTDAAGAVTDTVSYTADGEVVDRTGTTPVSVGWNGEYSDPDTDMVWLRARWYDPVSGRFISADPWHGNQSVPVSLNRYLFANADPVNNTDPTGLSTLIEQEATMALRLEINSIEAAYYMGLLSTLRTATTVLSAAAGVLATGGAAYWAVTAQAGDPNDQDGIDGPGTVPDIEVHESDDSAPELQPQADGAGARKPPECSPQGWSRGDDVYDAIRAGNAPAWSTVRARFWKNEALSPQYGPYSAADLDRMKRGLAPQRYSVEKGGIESMELSHEPTPRCRGGVEFVPRWPKDHEANDPDGMRRTGY